MANIYYTDTLGSNLNVFEKKTKSGEPFYYIYLNKNLIDDSEVENLVKLIEGSIVNKPKVKQKKGKLAYQITWSYTKPTPLNEQQILFDVMFKRLKNLGYVDTYQAKSSRSSKTTTTTPTPSTPSTTIDSVSIPTKTLEVGDEFYFMSDALSKARAFQPLYKVDSLNSGYVGVSWIDEQGKPHQLYQWVTIDEAQKFVKNGQISFPKGATSNMEFKMFDVFVENKTEIIHYISEVNATDRSYIMRSFSKLLNKGITTIVLENELKLYIKNGDFTQIKLEKGVEFASRGGYLSWRINDISGNMVKYEVVERTYNNVIEEKTTFIGDFLLDVTNMNFVHVNFSNTTPVQIGDEFIFVNDPNNITQSERDLVRSIVSIDLVKQDADYQNKKSGNIFTIPFDDIRTRMDEGTLIIVKRASQTTPSQQGTITSLSYYDLLKSNLFDGSLLRVLHVDSVVDKYDTFYNIPDDSLVDLEYKDPNTNNLEIQTLSFGDLKKNIEKGELEYLGQVRDGDSFVNGANMERFVKKVEDYPHDVKYAISDLNFNPPKVMSDGMDVMNVFTKSLLKQGYKLNLRLGSTTTTTTIPTQSTQPQVTPKPQINSDEIDALKKEIADLLFLKNGISDLDFEEKINISTEIAETQRKIDDLTEKLFEQRVGDENFFDRLFDQSFTPLKDRYDLDIVKNTLPEIISPSGEMSDLDEPMQLLVNSSEFKDWFGDWRNAYFYRNLEDFGGLNLSKVMNDKFEPLLVWHGTNNEFSYFDFEMFPANYFAVNKEYSEFFATNKGGQGFVLPFFLNIKNPLDLSDFGIENVLPKDFFDWMFLMTGMTPEELEVNPLFLDPTLPPSPIWVYIRNNPTMLKKIAMGNVYDGIKFYEFNPNEKDNPNKKAYETLAYIIFDPHQAKLADPNRGEILLSSLKSFMLKRGGKI